MEIVCKKIETIAEFIDAIRIRVDVFIKEQGFKPGLEPDENDKTATEFIAMQDNQIIATARYREISKGEFKIERIATKKEYRKKGIMSKLLNHMIQDIKKKGFEKITTQAQTKVQRFYEKNNMTSSPH